MAVYCGTGETGQQLFEQTKQGLLLGRGACVLVFFHVGGPAADITDAYGMPVVAAFLAMGAYFLDGAAFVDTAVEVDYEVIAYGAEAPGLVPGCNIGYCVVASFGRVGAVDDDFSDVSHSSSSSGCFDCRSFFCSVIFCDANIAPTPSMDAVSRRNWAMRYSTESCTSPGGGTMKPAIPKPIAAMKAAMAMKYWILTVVFMGMMGRMSD